MLTCTSFWMSLFRSLVKSGLMERMAEFFCTEIGVLSSLKVKRGFFLATYGLKEPVKFTSLYKETGR